MATSLENSKIASAGIVEPNGENRVKIRPVEVEIFGLTEIVEKKKEKKERYRSHPINSYAGIGWLKSTL